MNHFLAVFYSQMRYLSSEMYKAEMQPWRVCRTAAADLHLQPDPRRIEQSDQDQVPHQSEKKDSDPHKSERGIRIHILVWISNTVFLSFLDGRKKCQLRNWRGSGGPWTRKPRKELVLSFLNFKRQCHEMDTRYRRYFFEGLNMLIGTCFLCCADGFQVLSKAFQL